MIDAELILLLDEYENTNITNHMIAYFYRLKQSKRNRLPICAYGTLHFPPTYERLTEDFQMIRRMQELRIPRTLWHFVISFDLPVGSENTFYFCHQLAGAPTFGRIEVFWLSFSNAGFGLQRF